MAVNLSKNGAALMAAYEDVLDSKSNTNWALFTYEGNSNNIRLAEKGEGGLEEMVEELSSGKVMYAFCCVQDPNSGLSKYVLINWTGEGVKDSWKGACANHVTSMANFLKGAHVTINARDEDDVDPESILGKVGKTSGADFRFNKETRGYGNTPAGPVGSVYQKTNAVDEIQRTNKENFWAQDKRDEVARKSEVSKPATEKAVEKDRKEEDETRYNAPAGPVGSVYQKTNAVDEIQRTNKENFWAQDKRDEAARKSEVSKQAMAKTQQMEKDRQEEEEKQSAERDKRTKDRSSQIDQQRAFEKRQESVETKPEQQQETGQRDSQRKGIRFTASVQKANEAKGLVSQRSFNPKDVFQQGGQNSAVSNGQSPVASRPGKLQSPFLSQSRTESETTPKPKGQRKSTPPITDTSPVTEAPPIRHASPVAPPIRDTSPVRSESPVAAPSPAMPDVSTSPVLTPAMPDVSTSPVRTAVMPDVSTSPVQTPDVPTSPVQTTVSAEDDDWSDDFDEEEDAQDLYNDPQESPGQEEEEVYEEETPSSVAEEDIYENVYDDDVTPAAVEEHGAEHSGHSTCSARALYDYQAADDSEITFDPDDIITGIEQMDDGWWRGYAPDGHFGMFPANYVELV